MPWTYHQSTGQLYHNGTLVGTGYSGAGSSTQSGRNNPAMQGVANQGPIPQGQWHIGEAYDDDNLGPTVLALTPTAGTNAFNRTAFRIHGNNSTNNASHGCIILGPNIRHQISDSGDSLLNVVP